MPTPTFAPGEVEDARSNPPRRAYSMDIISLPVYEMLAGYILKNGQYQRSVETLEVYLVRAGRCRCPVRLGTGLL
ncbi:MAG: hypothetical protein IPO22_14690 [Anaerolineales bacterium]|nr:hypothetical protein [Anaerolineales bacterium]